MTLKYLRRCLKLQPLACVQATHRRDRDWRTCSKIQGRFPDRNSSGGYSCYQDHFRIDVRFDSHGSERCKFRQVLMHPSERLMIRLPPRWSRYLSPYNRTAIHP
ncbi:hypothetical protein TNCV_1012871 [Trichonephila clavipes]|uniref:Uncharacterized protein n=1 Tax=Trichonephila clavipes TaxID=2585209 RepID=A0A8X6VXD8_TRICX|nr:hypothetical protein TNCV_1012871 [Trichonephila clavipes]